ncbi:TPA: type II toxin-antitoxin system HicB family antitoxin [Candidatus Poribacteria bacterium]|nr:type II toxin-antitoxin system HicB family antitoxin [Candidatus Poribacteria bacterium]
MAKVLSYKVVLEPAEEGGYTVYVPSLPGCISEGDTYQEALKNIQEAIEGWIEVSKEFGDEIPSSDVIIDTVQVSV